MYGRWFNIAIISLWIVTMSWLVKEKVLPPLLTGPAPDQVSLIETAESDQEVSWLIRWNQCPIGWAMSRVDRNEDDTTRMFTTVHFDYLPISGMLPSWLFDLSAWSGTEELLEKSLQQESSARRPVDSCFETDAISELLISADGQLQQINSSITLPSLGQTIDLIGKVNGDQVELDIQTKDFSYKTKIPLHPKTLMSNSLTPQTYLPNLHVGQTWLVGVVNPFCCSDGSVDVMYAKVVGRQLFRYQDKSISAWLIEYHDQPNLEYAGKKGSRCRIWVHPNGMVLKQELRFFKECFTFERQTADRVAELCRGGKLALQTSNSGDSKAP